MIKTGTFAFLGGVVFLQQFSQLPPTWFLVGAAFFLFPLFVSSNVWLKTSCFFLAGFVWASAAGHWQLGKQLPPELIRTDIQVIGHIASLPQKSERRVRFDFDIEKVLPPHNFIRNQKIKLSWYQYHGDELQVGDKWQLTVRLKPTRNYYNPGSLEYAGILLQQGILSTGYVRKSDNNKLVIRDFLNYPIQRLRQHIRRLLTTHLSQQSMEPILRGLVIGDRSDVDAQSWSMLRNTGTIHLLAISGLHIGLMAGMGFIVFRRLWSLSARCCCVMAAPRAAAVFAWMLALIYAGLAGFSLPTQRALIMLSVVLLAVFMQRQTRPENVFCMALLAILIFDPFAVLSVGFWLSFIAIALIYILLATCSQHHSRWYQWARIQILISITLMPVLIYFFQQAPGLSPVANIIAVPFVSIVILPIALIGVICLLIQVNTGIWVLEITTNLLELLWQLLNRFAAIEFSVLSVAVSSVIPVLLAVAGLLVLLLPRGIPAKWLGIILCLPLVFSSDDKPGQGNVFLSVLDVGQGLATVIQTKQHVLVFDAGPRYSDKLDAARAVINPFLLSRTIRNIDAVVISHGDNDHIGGAKSLLDNRNVGVLYTSVPAQLSEYASNRCQAGTNWEWDGVWFEFLYPDSDDYLSGSSENNLSCVLQIRTINQHILLTGDIEKQAESKLIRRYKKTLQSDILVVPHHGSNTSSTRVFLATINPELAIFPVGWLNRFDLPSDKVIKRYQDLGIDMLSTGHNGAVLLSTGEAVEISTYRQMARRYWHYQNETNDTSRYGMSLLK